MSEGKHKVMLFLNLKKLANRLDHLKTILILQNQMLLSFFVSLLWNKEKTYQDMAEL